MPTWHGDIDSYDSYKIQVRYFLRTKPQWQTPQQLARLILGLKGKAKELVEKLPEESREQLEKSELVYLNFLKKHLLEGEIPELGRAFRTYLQMKRQRQESMVLYTMRHRENLSKLDKAMKAVEGEDMLAYLRQETKDIPGTRITEEDDEDKEDVQSNVSALNPRTPGSQRGPRAPSLE